MMNFRCRGGPNHGHIWDEGLIEAGASLKWVYDQTQKSKRICL